MAHRNRRCLIFSKRRWIDTDIEFLQMFSESVGQVSEVSEEDASSDGTREEFENLIKGKYSTVFKERTQGIIDKRFAKMKGYEKTAKAVLPLLQELGARFPDIDKADTEGLINAFLSKEKNEVQNTQQENIQETDAENTQGENAADENGKSANKTSDIREDIIKAAHVAAKAKSAQALANYLNEESEKLREIYPSFDLSGEIGSNPDFLKLLESGVSLRRAFEAVNLEKIMGSALKYAVMKAGKNTADAIQSQSRVSENSVVSRASSVKHTDVNQLTEKEIHKILSQVSKGAKISF